jgi:hypothetical protein
MTRLPQILITALATIALVAGCATTTPDIEPDVATTLQNQVVLVAGEAASGNHQAALDRLNDLQAELDEAEAAQTIQPARVDAIQVGIDAVRADLTVLIAAAEEAAAAELAAEQAKQDAADKAAEEAADKAAEEAAKQAEKDAREAEKEAERQAREDEKNNEEPGGPGNGNGPGSGDDED